MGPLSAFAPVRQDVRIQDSPGSEDPGFRSVLTYGRLRPPYARLWTVPYPTKGLLVEYTQALELIVLKELGKMPQ